VKETLVFVVALSVLLCFSHITFAQDVSSEGVIKAKATEESKDKEDKLIFLVPEKPKDGSVQDVINQTLGPQGLYFTPGGVRPMESVMQSYPTIGDDVILLVPE